MVILILLQLLVIVFGEPDDLSNEIQLRILYGQTVKIEDYPYYAGLNNCGAAIISNQWILTAAHCVADVNPRQQNYVWVGGESFANSQKFLYNKVIVHENYTRKNYLGLLINDIALIKLASPLEFGKKIQPVKLPTTGPITYKTVFVGRGIDETGKVSKNVQKLDLIRLTTEECISSLPQQYQGFARQNIKFLESINICAKRERDMPGICMGDSGSPLVSDNTVVGLASYIGGKACSQFRLGFYVNVASYVPWIKAKTGL